ncbi:MAG: class I SAM-dependent methyltransferase [Armatimonadetes bacterium]|nr:class I SAM-dependent methyltransferase [Armatimonadota bacterium]
MKEKNNIRQSFNARALEWKDGDFKNLLDLGCGSGEIIFELLKNNKVKFAYGIDFSEKMIDLAKKEAKNIKLEKKSQFEVKDAENLNHLSKNKFDIILAIGLIEYLENDQKFIENIRKLLKKEGILIITVPNNSSPFFVLDYIITLIYRLFKNNFLTKNIFNFIKYKILKRKSKKEIKPFPQKTYNPKKLNTFLIKNGFLIEKKIFNLYASEWLARLFPNLLNIFKKLEKLENSYFKYWGKNYIIMAKKIE